MQSARTKYKVLQIVQHGKRFKIMKKKTRHSIDILDTLRLIGFLDMCMFIKVDRQSRMTFDETLSRKVRMRAVVRFKVPIYPGSTGR